jgi:sigma-B regulation protein RsbU (phosphoserine phosphatase)
MNRIRVLAVDDAVANLMILKGILKGNDFKVVTSTNALDALQLFKQEFFDVILLDVIMPGIDGFELRKLIREVDIERPIIFLTSMVEDGSMKMLNQIVWDSNTFYLNKVTDKETLIRKIKEVVANHRIRNVERQRSNKLEGELKLAGELQRILLPEWCEIDEHIMASSLYKPASHVSGDIFEIIRISDAKYLLFIGDIAGHGVSAALYMATIQAWLKVSLKKQNPSPHDLLNQLNQFFCKELQSSTYMTALVAIIDFDINHISVQSAGHPPVFIGSASQKVAMTSDSSRGGLPIGWFKETEYLPSDNFEYDFPDDAIFICTTDGVFDIENEQQEVLAESDYREITEALFGDTDCLTFPYRLCGVLEKMGYFIAPDDYTFVAVSKNIRNPNRKQHLIPAKLSAIAEVAEDFASMGATPEQGVEIDLLVHEYLNNVIIHGGKQADKKQRIIYISIEKNDDVLEIRGLEQGAPWNIQEAAENSGGEPGNSYATSGRGAQILQSITEYISYNSFCGLNETRFVLRRGAEDQHEKGHH